MVKMVGYSVITQENENKTDGKSKKSTNPIAVYRAAATWMLSRAAVALANDIDRRVDRYARAFHFRIFFKNRSTGGDEA